MRLKTNGRCKCYEFSCELREKLEDADMDKGRASSDEAALHLGGTSNSPGVPIRFPQSRLLSTSTNWTPKTEHIVLQLHATKWSSSHVGWRNIEV
jgi:hypothetical protein